MRCIVLTLMLWSLAAGSLQAQSGQNMYFVGYETLEMAMNRFQYFAGELGYRLSPRTQVRLAIMETNLTERHLSSSWEAAAVDGDNVEGYFRGYEASLDRFFWRNWYFSGSVGWFHDTYEHTVLDEGVENKTFTVGSGLGYRRSDLFGIPRLYLNLDFPVRFYFDKLPETTLGETTVREHLIVNNIWLFVGFEF